MSVYRPGPGRRLEQADAPLRHRILEAALEVMSRKGFERASIAAIAGRAGVARATVYQHFCDKQDILLALAERITERILEAIETWAPLPTSPASGERELRGTIETRVAQVLAAIAANADAARLVGRLTRGSDPSATHEMLRKIGDRVVAVLTGEIEAATAYRWARACDAPVAARFILGGLEKVAIDAIERDEAFTLRTDAMAAEIGALIFFGLAHRKLLAAAPSTARDSDKEGSRTGSKAGAPPRREPSAVSGTERGVKHTDRRWGGPRPSSPPRPRDPAGRR
ncbi:MAG TPA: helix-turn-helix domain-containing protein [Candidatus Binatia bacterium]|nr:helix-turn-helix domain-containing protein [Candidatus Binatia bacterium]